MEVSAEVQFAQTLASNEKKYRDRALKRLKKYISARSCQEEGLSDDDFIKIWKGLHYCMWMQDKPLLQEELSRNIAQLLHAFPHLNDAVRFANVFFITEAREWTGIDRLRLDKFMMFIRDILGEIFSLISNAGWPLKSCQLLSQSLGAHVTNEDKAKVPYGIKMHIADIFLPELRKVSLDGIDGAKLTTLMFPFLHFILKTKRRELAQTMYEKTLLPVFQSYGDWPWELGKRTVKRRQISEMLKKSKKQLRNHLSSDGDSDDDNSEGDEEMEEEEDSEEEEEEEEDVSDTDSAEDDDMDVEGDDDTEKNGKRYKFDMSCLLRLMQRLASDNLVDSRARSYVYGLVNTFANRHPDILNSPDKENEGVDISCVGQLIGETVEKGSDKKKRKKKKRAQFEKEEAEENDKQKHLNQNHHTNSSSTKEDQQKTLKKKKKKNKNKKNKENLGKEVQSNNVECQEESESRATILADISASTSKKNKKRKRNSVVEEDGDENENNATPSPSAKKRKKMRVEETEEDNINGNNNEDEKEQQLKKRKKLSSPSGDHRGETKTLKAVKEEEEEGDSSNNDANENARVSAKKKSAISCPVQYVIYPQKKSNSKPASISQMAMTAARTSVTSPYRPCDSSTLSPVSVSNVNSKRYHKNNTSGGGSTTTSSSPLSTTISAAAAATAFDGSGHGLSSTSPPSLGGQPQQGQKKTFSQSSPSTKASPNKTKTKKGGATSPGKDSSLSSSDSAVSGGDGSTGLMGAMFNAMSAPGAFIKKAVGGLLAPVSSAAPASAPATPMMGYKAGNTPDQLTPSSEKKVVFDLKKNRANKFKDYLKTLSLEPLPLAFEPSKSPAQGILKSPSTDSLVNNSSPARKQRKGSKSPKTPVRRR